MLDEKKVQLRADERALQNLGACDTVIPAVEDDWATEFSDYILAVRVVDSLDEAIEHISKYSSGHSEAIVTNNYGHARQFTSRVDAAAVYVNVSTRFTDGGQLGPMGVNELTSQKFIITGDGQIRE